MPEWLNGAVSKTVGGLRSLVGSNPTPSATSLHEIFLSSNFRPVKLNRRNESGANRRGKVLFATLAILLVGATAAVASSIPNGDFEKGNFSGWSKQSTGAGSLFIYDVASRVLPAPPYGGATLPKPIGTYAASVRQNGPSTNYLTRTLEVPGDATTLNVKVFWINEGGPPSPPPPASAPRRAGTGYWRFPGTWSTGGGKRIQYFRLDLVKPAAKGFTTKQSDILATIFRPKTGSTKARSGGWLAKSIDVTQFRGRKIKFRLVEGDNSGYMNVGLDSLRFGSGSLPTG